eukprot:4996063-Amphidinium_carterae.1
MESQGCHRLELRPRNDPLKGGPPKKGPLCLDHIRTHGLEFYGGIRGSQGWTLALLYLAFCMLYVTLFFANVAPVDQKSWG